MVKIAFGTKYLWIAFIVLVVGCGDPSMAVVEGTVTLDGKPLPNAFILFQPKKGTLEDASSGQTDNVGHFTLNRVTDGGVGAKAGLHQISITTIAPNPEADERTPRAKDLVPPKYQDGSLTFDVPPSGSASADFALITR